MDILYRLYLSERASAQMVDFAGLGDLSGLINRASDYHGYDWVIRDASGFIVERA